MERAAAGGGPAEPSRELAVYDLDQRRQIDEQIVGRTIDFMTRSVQAKKPFYAYVPFTLVHVPALPSAAFAGKTGNGDFADCLAEMDANVGRLCDAVDQLQIRDNTIVVFTSDNGPDSTFPSQGTSGPWSGYYFTHMEGSLRTPFVMRWPNRVPAARVSNEIVHSVDTFTTFARIAGAAVPQDRAIDGVDQTEFLLGKSERSARAGFPVFIADRMEAVKWKNWKMAFYEQERDWWSAPTKLGVPKIFDLLSDPKEEYGATLTPNAWVGGPMMKIVAEFEQSLKRYPPIATGTPDPYQPPGGGAIADLCLARRFVMTTAQKNIKLMQSLDNAWNAQDWETFDARYRPDTIVRWPAQPATHGRRDHGPKAFKCSRRFRTTRCTTGRIAPFLRTAKGRCSIAKFTGTMIGPMKGPYGKDIAPTGKSFEVDSCTVARWDTARSWKNICSTTWLA